MVQSASAVLAATMSPQIHPAGFRISDRPVAPSFAHPDSFQPIQEIMLRDEACLVSSLALGGVEGTYVRYWDESSMVAVLEFQVATPQSSTMPNAKDKKEKKKKGKICFLCFSLPMSTFLNTLIQILLHVLPRLPYLLHCLYPTSLSRLVSTRAPSKPA